MRRERFLLITNIFPPQIGGPATFMDRLGDCLARLGHSVTVVCSSETRCDESDRNRPFVVRRVSLASREIYEMRIRMVLTRELLRHRIVLVNGLETYVGQIAGAIRRSYFLKIVGDTVWETARNRGTTSATIDDFQKDADAQASHQRLIDRRKKYLRQARKVIVPSDYVRQMVTGWGVDQDRVVTVPNGIEPQEFCDFRPRRRTEGTFELVFVGRHTNWKGIETILLATKDLPGVHVTVIGDGPEFTHLFELCRQLGASGRVRFTGRLNRDGVKGFVSSSHALVLTSLYEGMSHTLLEAMAMGVPCIASECGGNPEVIRDGVNGLLVPAQNVSALRGAAEALRQNEDLRYRLACRAKEDSFAFDMERTVQTISSLLVIRKE
jgi:glycosyltransferase involved in cell wall biosynthesis